MVIGLVGREVIRFGARQASKYLTQLHRYDVRIHKSLYGASGGRGVRHGRDAGIFVSQYIQGDDLDTQNVPSKTPSRPSIQTRDRRERRDSRKYSKRHRCDRYCRRPNRYK